MNTPILDLQLAQVVAEDLSYLFTEWNQDIDDASLRRTSPTLRSLLVEGQLAKVAYQAGKEVKIMAPAISKAMTEAELREKSFYQAGGARYKGVLVQTMSHTPRSHTPEEIKANYERTKPFMGRSTPVKLGAFLKQISFVVNGVLINREEVIKYVANKLGGAHYDSSRSTSSQSSGQSLEEKYALLDSIQTGMIAGKNPVYYELLSIGQCVANSRDVRHLKKHLQSLLDRPNVIRL